MFRRHLIAISLLVAAAATAPSHIVRAEDREISAADRDHFEQHVRPILVDRCYDCHSHEAETAEGDLYLDSRAGWQTGGSRGPAVVPGEPGDSLLLDAIQYEDVDLQMPPDGKIPDREIKVLRDWIARGAPDPRVLDSTPTKPKNDFDIDTRRQTHWAWQPIVQSDLPSSNDADWPHASIDHFILARLESSGLAPAPPAEKATWLRRVTYALVGLPPTPDEVRAFLDDDSVSAYETVVDRLLDAPSFGERWAQHWLDLVRYAETHGHEQDFPIPHAYRYRDYVIRAFNADVPYDRLLTEHVAGDLVHDPRIDTTTRTNQSIQGTGFWHLGEATHSPVDIRGDETDRVANQIDVFSRAFLGLTVACARCHDHKFDAISAADYYALAGFLQSSSRRLADVSDPAARDRAQNELTDLQSKTSSRLANTISAALAPEHRTSLNPNLDAWQTELAAAASDPTNILYPLARALNATDASAPFDPAALREQIHAAWKSCDDESAAAHAAQQVARTEKAGEGKSTTHKRPFEPSDVVVDYTRLEPGDWISAGHRFGPRPLPPASLLIADEADPPTFRFTESTAATAGNLSNKLTGLLRTPTFEITADDLWYRYAGQGDVFLVIDSHRVVKGPLHAVLQQKLELSDSPRWHRQHVADYIGHRGHIELNSNAQLQIFSVQFAAAEPPPPTFRANARLVELVDNDDLATPADWIAAYRDLFHRAACDLAEKNFASPADAADAAQIVNQLSTIPSLLNANHDNPNHDNAADQQKILAAHKQSKSRIEASLPAPVYALALLDGDAQDEPVHLRGNYKTLSPAPVPRRLLEAIEGPAPITEQPGSGRLALARRLTDPSNPLVARVYVNRVWHHLFGRGIVPTVDDFGVMGQPPTHPELLDHLAAQFVSDGWSTKRLIRRLVLSSTYRMSSRTTGVARDADPTNRLFHHMPIRRLDGEAIRDSLLAISGRLDPKRFGPSVMIHITPFMRSNRSPSGSGPADGDGRRSIYVEVRRNHLSHFLTAFDKPAPFTTIGRRSVSNSAAQPLILLNDPLVHELAADWADHLLRQHSQNHEQLVRAAYLAAFAAEPTPRQLARALEFVATHPDSASASAAETSSPPSPARQAWVDFCHTLFNAKQFIFLN